MLNILVLVEPNSHWEPLHDLDEVPGRIFRRTRLQTIVEEAKERGETLPSVDPKGVATLIVASLEGALMMSRLQRNDEALRRVQSHLNWFLENDVAITR